MCPIGILAIFTWRILAKSLLHRILPPVYRFLGQCMTLPHRRFYTPATDYTNVPFSADHSSLRALPSVLDLPGMVELEVDGVSASVDGARRVASRMGSGGKLCSAHERSRSRGPEMAKSKTVAFGSLGHDQELGGNEPYTVKHYDADGELSDYLFDEDVIDPLSTSCDQDPGVRWDRRPRFRRYARNF